MIRLYHYYELVLVLCVWLLVSDNVAICYILLYIFWNVLFVDKKYCICSLHSPWHTLIKLANFIPICVLPCVLVMWLFAELFVF